MDVYIDGKPVPGEVPGESLQAILEFIAENLLDGDHTFRELQINDRLYSEADMGEPAQIPRAGIQSLQVTTISSAEIIAHFLANSERQITTLQEAARRLAEVFLVEDSRQANEQYLDFLDSIDLFLKMLQQIKDSLDLDFATLGGGEATAAALLGRMEALIDEMLAAQEASDWVLLADILHTDLPKVLEAWRPLLGLMRG